MSIVGNSSCLRPIFRTECEDGTVYEYVGDSDNLAFLRWIGFERARAHNEVVKILTYKGFDPSKSLVPDGDCCPGSRVITGGVCVINQSCFGIIRQEAPPTKNGGNGLPNCVNDPRYTIGGRTIDTDAEWNLAVLASAMYQGLNLQIGIGTGPQEISGIPDHWGFIPLIDGTAQDAGYYDNCSTFVPHVLDWAGNPTCDAKPQAGVLYDGAALPEGFTNNLYNAITGIYKALRRNFYQMQGMNQGGINYGDIAIVGDPEAFDCILKCAVCYSHCGNDITRMDNFEASRYLTELSQGGEGWGEIRFDNVRIPLIPYAPINPATGQSVMQNADGTYNFAMIWRGSGANRPFTIQYNPLNDATRGVTRENGMILLSTYEGQHCNTDSMSLEWRIKLRNPCLQTWITRVACDTIQACKPAYPPTPQPDPIEDCKV